MFRFILAAGMLAPALVPAAPAVGQQAPAYDVVHLPGAGMGKVVIAFRSLGSESPEGLTHEFVYAHPIWAHGFMRERLRIDCKTYRVLRADRAFRFWSGGAPVVHETEPAPALTFAIFQHRSGSPLASIACSPRGFHPKRMDAATATTELRRTAAANAVPRRVTLATLDGRKMSAAFPSKPAPFRYPPAFAGVDATEVGLEVERKEGTFRLSRELARRATWRTAADAISFYRKESEALTPRMLVSGGDAKSLSLTGFVIDYSRAEPNTVSRLIVCKVPNPRAVYFASAEYRTTPEEIEAWRFVNSMRVDC